jgi:hypothetical protein
MTCDRAGVPASPSGAHDDVWQALIDRCLAWGKVPSQIDEDELESPSAAASSAACRLLLALRERGLSPPIRVVGDGEGGVVLEQRGGSIIEEFRVDAQGAGEYLMFDDCRLVERRKI